MSVLHPHQVRCACGHRFTIPLADSINAARSPALRAAILNGDLHRAVCPECKAQFTVEKSFYYTDISKPADDSNPADASSDKRNVIFQVHPRGQRHRWRDASSMLDEAAESFPSLPDAATRQLRVVFGMDELREKLVAQDAGLDDHDVELLKALLIYEHPVLMRKRRLRLSLVGSTDETFDFVAVYEHDPKRFELKVPRRLARRLNDDSESDFSTWAAESRLDGGVPSPSATWINVWRYSTQPDGLAALRTLAQQIREGKLDVGDAPKTIDRVVKGIAASDHLPPWAKRDLRVLLDFARDNDLDEDLIERIFEKRFFVDLSDEWTGTNDDDAVPRLWNILDALPAAEVEASTKISALDLDTESGLSRYEPSSGDIVISESVLDNPKEFVRTVLHEVGHAVNEQHRPLIDKWLESRFGWQAFKKTKNSEIDKWVALMGSGGGWTGFTKLQQGDVRDHLRLLLGPGKHWGAASVDDLPPAHPWHGAQFGPRLAFEHAQANWWTKHATWHTHDGRSFFLNYYYAELGVVTKTTLTDIIAKMPNPYAAMSSGEFFAEMYAVFRDPNGSAQTILPKDVRDWLTENLPQ